MEMDEARADIELAMERPLFTPALRPRIADLPLLAGEEDADPSALFEQVIVDKARIERHIRRVLQDKGQVSLSELVAAQPLRQGLAELIAYLHVGEDSFRTVTDENTPEPVSWQSRGVDGETLTRTARMPRIIFIR
jgi:hypothetical protein